MFRYTTTYINIISVGISIIIFVLITSSCSIYSEYKHNGILKTSFSVESNNTSQLGNEEPENVEPEKQQSESPQLNETESVQEDLEKCEWYLEIPSIGLKAEIAEGTEKQTMDKFIGHFEETSKTNGNIGLAAHNRGYENNYFENLKKLKEGDVIIYKYKEFTREYVVQKHLIIKDTDWTYLGSTEEDTITLITCVENQPEYRRCIQATHKTG